MARTAYWVIDLASYAVPTNAQIAAGQRTGSVAALKSGSEAFAATSGSGTITEATAVTGLTAGTEYRLSWTIYDDVALDYPASAPQHKVWSARDAGLSTETDAAFALAVVQLKAAGLASETDTASALARVQIRTAGLATEVDTAFALSPGQNGTVGLASETDAALALAGRQLRPAGLATEADTAFARGAVQIKAAGLAAETDAAFARNAVQVRATGLATETDTAYALAPNVPGAVGLAAETDTALALSARQIRPTGLATETGVALSLASISARTAGLSLEINAGFSLVPLQLRAVGLATETDAAYALTAGGGAGVGSAADVWNYVLSNGLTAEQTLVAVWSALSTPTEIADAILNRDFAAVADTNARTLLQAARFLRNRWSIAGTTLTVCEEDDATPAWTATVTAAPGADPISGTDPT